MSNRQEITKENIKKSQELETNLQLNRENDKIQKQQEVIQMRQNKTDQESLNYFNNVFNRNGNFEIKSIDEQNMQILKNKKGNTYLRQQQNTIEEEENSEIVEEQQQHKFVIINKDQNEDLLQVI
ncbi:hypothetical protein PPERSA_02357 [Pseudocohnilembus persalinus]|uniref:Uncharacterized protein n=1 Tax=Pseudocohnilembus persalinus TaxID=266149 RepID=A0A0V0QUB6_PSEPJ|nr:hypothetical protein PPERSA_02357 [Pseudocohnilembus persalinus]|eukprot:KRX05825.1 hypothetical protein PPERSA_02357 [Pseudocohnilembus persalinus]